MRTRGFSMIEVMISSAIVGLIGAGAMTVAVQAGREAGHERSRTVAIADAQSTVDRIYNAAGVVAAYGGATRLCQFLSSSGAPMDVTGGGTLSGTCPNRTATNMPVAGTVLRRTVAMSSITFGSGTATQVVVTISGGRLMHDVVLKTVLPL